METSQSNSSLGYGKPPWVFKGSALYQLHLVKAETARAFIPKELRLVEAFGYTLGGFFLANYEDSPAGAFDELVILSGIVWNPPVSCAWAARVLVNSEEACKHGRKDVGLPSQVANFTRSVRAVQRTKRSRFGGFLEKIGINYSPDDAKNYTDFHVKERNNQTATDICSISLITTAKLQNERQGWMGPGVKLSLPSFSGRTEYNSHLLKYSCQIECRLRAVSPAEVLGPTESNLEDETSSDPASFEYKRKMSISVLLSKPILALQFNSLKMKVEAPTLLQIDN